MINSIDFVNQKIDELVIQFPSIKCSYEFDELDNTHSVEVLPSEFFKISDEFSKIENKIYDEFFELFPYEGLYFITDDVLVPISNPIYSKEGCDYAKSMQYNNAGHLKGNLLNDTINYIITNNSVFNVDSFNEINVYPSNNNRIDLLNSPVMAGAFPTKVLIENGGENNYALAA